MQPLQLAPPQQLGLDRQGRVLPGRPLIAAMRRPNLLQRRWQHPSPSPSPRPRPRPRPRGYLKAGPGASSTTF
eukprot:3980982-Prymnesium_polylepis.1